MLQASAMFRGSWLVSDWNCLKRQCQEFQKWPYLARQPMRIGKRSHLRRSSKKYAFKHYKFVSLKSSKRPLKPRERNVRKHSLCCRPHHQFLPGKNCKPRCQIPTTSDVWPRFICHGWRLYVLCAESRFLVSSCSFLRRQNPDGGQARRSPS